MKELLLSNPIIWQSYRFFIDKFFGMYRKRMETIRRFGVTDSMSIIDIACGTGQYSALTNSSYLGVDLNPKYIEYAQNNYGNHSKRFLCADANNIPVPQISYDVALLIDATHHLSDDANNQLFATFNRISPRFVVICDPIKQNPRNFIGRFLNYLDRGNYIRTKHELTRLIEGKLAIEKVVDLKIMGIESVCIFAKPKI